MTVFSFEDDLEAKQWALDTQKSRRNLDKWELGQIALKLKPEIEARARANMSAGGGDKKSAEVRSGFPKTENPIAEKINTEELAALLHLSRVGLIMKFKKHMGCTPADFLIRLRMQYAKHLLLEGNTPINEIARLCGYHNAYYFSNAFKHIYRSSPLHYRQTKRKASQESTKPISDNEA